ncbi:MAG: nuclear transport factor 2 family protein [Pseudomonadota bacterium]
MTTEETIRAAVAAYGAQDLERVSALVADDVCYRINAHRETGPYHADCQSRDAFFAAVGTILEDWDVQRYALGDLIVAGDRGAAQIDIEMASRHRDFVFRGRLALFLRVTDGQLSEIVEYHDTAAAGLSRAAA